MGQWIKITVSDTGLGIAPEDRKHIFEPFFTTKPIGQGTGLGLAQVYGIIKQHDGHIEVHSQVGEGTVFTIFLPALEFEEIESHLPKSTVEIDGAGQNVLLVEDDQATKDALVVLMEAQGYQVLKASNGKEALAILKDFHEPLTLVVSDMVMPEMGGMELYQALRPNYPGLKMLLITGHPLEENQQIMAKSENLNWLQKPFSVGEFNQAVSILLNDS
jgi:CheY-like chemotaxis protein